MSPTITRTCWPLPGGKANYVESLLLLLAAAADGPIVTTYLAELRRQFPTVRSDRMAISYITNVPFALGLIERVKDRYRLTTEGNALLVSAHIHNDLADLLLSRVWGCGEILALLAESPMPIRHLHSRMHELGFPWRTQWQLRYRLNWLQTVGLVDGLSYSESRDRYPEWALTERCKSRYGSQTNERDSRFSDMRGGNE